MYTMSVMLYTQQPHFAYWMTNIHVTDGHTCIQTYNRSYIAIKNGEAGSLVKYPNNTTYKINIPSGKHCHDHSAEIMVITATEKLSIYSTKYYTISHGCNIGTGNYL